MSDPPDLPGVKHEYVDAGGLHTHVALAGPDDAPAVLLLHGWPQNWWCWREVIPELATRFRVIAPDLRGHGWTPAPAHGSYEKEQLATDLLALLDALEVERVTWVGHDWGGWTGFLAALRAPERFERMLAVCIPHPWSPASLRRLAILLSYQGPLSMPLLGPRVAKPMVRALLKARDHSAGSLSDDDVALFCDQIAPEVSVAMYRTFLTRELPPIVRGRYGRSVLEVPTTVMLGERDPITRDTPAGPVRHQPQMSIEVVPKVAHWVPEQRPDAIIDWVDRA